MAKIFGDNDCLGPYKGYYGTFSKDLEKNKLYGHVLFLKDIKIYYGNSAIELQEEFEKVIDKMLMTNDFLDYLTRE